MAAAGRTRPELGIFHAVTDVHGNIMVSEDRIRYAYESGAGDPSAVYHELSLALGEAWTNSSRSGTRPKAPRALAAPGG